MWFFIVVVMFFVGIIYWLGGGFSQDPSTPVSTSKNVEYHFERLNNVEGILHVDGKKIHTYQIGFLTLDNTIMIKFYNSYNKATRINDIYFKEQSLFGYANPGMSWQEKTEYALSALKQASSRGACSIDLVSEVEDIVLEVETMNNYIEEGHLYQILNDTEDYAWK